jgi:hypothetical protein
MTEYNIATDTKKAQPVPEQGEQHCGDSDCDHCNEGPSTAPELPPLDDFYERLDKACSGHSGIAQLLRERPENLHDYQGCANDPKMQPLDKEKSCCTVCDARKKCHVCGQQTLFACSDCRIDLGVTVHVCNKKECIDAHEQKCPATLKSTIAGLREQIEEQIFVCEQAEKHALDLTHGRDSREYKVVPLQAARRSR